MLDRRDFTVAMQDSAVMLDVVDSPDLKEVADIAYQHLERVVESLRTTV